jgi:nitrile hydratase subunit beta
MNGIHDLGGMTCFGRVVREEQEPVFHVAWERRVFAMTLAARVANLDEFRHAVERMDPLHYLASTYYEHWLAALETLLVEKGFLTKEELETGTAKDTSSTRTPLSPDDIVRIVQHGRSTQRQTGRTTPRFRPGDRIVARNIHPSGHTRLPRYVRGKQGVIDCIHGTFVYPDTNAHGGGEQPQPVYCVRFDAHTLWGPTVPARDSIYIDLWEDYLEPA